MTTLEIVLIAVLVTQSLMWLVSDFARFDPERRGD